jgi:hypothetical protein
MLKDQIARNKAAEALGLPSDNIGHWLSNNWPETIPVSTLLIWQFPDDTSIQTAIQKDIRIKIEAGEIPKRYTDHYLVAAIPPLAADDFVQYLEANDFLIS